MTIEFIKSLTIILFPRKDGKYDKGNRLNTKTLLIKKCSYIKNYFT